MRTKKRAPVSQKSFEFLMFDRNAAHNDTRKHCQFIFQVLANIVMAEVSLSHAEKVFIVHGVEVC